MHTPGPWRWEVSMKSKRLHLVGGKPMYDLTIIEPTRWGMGSAKLMIRDTAHDGMNIMHKLHERADWVAPFHGREHHAGWCADVTHPDMRLIAAAPDMLQALLAIANRDMTFFDGCVDRNLITYGEIQQARAAILKATGEQP